MMKRQEPPCDCSVAGCGNYIDTGDLFWRVGKNNERVICMQCQKELGIDD
jgi:hypothetical protein